jgi:UPF0716 family protein affecting phage T7 exclusion
MIQQIAILAFHYLQHHFWISIILFAIIFLSSFLSILLLCPPKIAPIPPRLEAKIHALAEQARRYTENSDAIRRANRGEFEILENQLSDSVKRPE